MDEITPEEADAYAAQIPHWLAGATYNGRISELRTAWNVLCPGAANPWIGMRRKPRDAKPRMVLSAEQVRAVVATARGRCRGELSPLILLGAYTGLRLGDAVRLRWGNIDLANGVIAVTTRKTGSRVAIPILPDLGSKLAAMADKRRSPYVFPVIYRRVERYNGRVANISQCVNKAMRDCGIATSYQHPHTKRRRPLCGYHSLRHTFVTRAIEAGVPVEIVAAIVGHASVEMTHHYTHVGVDALKQAFARAGLMDRTPRNPIATGSTNLI